MLCLWTKFKEEERSSGFDLRYKLAVLYYRKLCIVRGPMSKCVISHVIVEDGQSNGHMDMYCLLSVHFVFRWLFSQWSQYRESVCPTRTAAMARRHTGSKLVQSATQGLSRLPIGAVAKVRHSTKSCYCTSDLLFQLLNLNRMNLQKLYPSQLHHAHLLFRPPPSSDFIH